MEPTTFTVRYRSTVAADAVKKELDDILQQLRNDGVSELKSARLAVTRDGAGFDPATTALVITVAAPIAQYIVQSLWDSLVLPLLKRKFGQDEFQTKQD